MAIADAQKPRKSFLRPAKVVVTLKSRNGQKVQVDNESDRQFLELADKFVIEAGKVERDPARKTSRLSLR